MHRFRIDNSSFYLEISLVVEAENLIETTTTATQQRRGRRRQKSKTLTTTKMMTFKQQAATCWFSVLVFLGGLHGGRAQTLREIVNGLGRLSRLESTIDLVSDELLLDSYQAVTFLAPRNGAFPPLIPNPDAPAPFRLISKYVNNADEWSLHLRTYLLAHLFPRIIPSGDFSSGQTLTAVTGDRFNVQVIGNNGDTIRLTPGDIGPVFVTSDVDITSSQGLVHIVDGLLAPSFLSKTVADVARENLPTLSSLVVEARVEPALWIINAVTSTLFLTLYSCFGSII